MTRFVIRNGNKELIYDPGHCYLYDGDTDVISPLYDFAAAIIVDIWVIVQKAGEE